MGAVRGQLSKWYPIAHICFFPSVLPSLLTHFFHGGYVHPAVSQIYPSKSIFTLLLWCRLIMCIETYFFPGLSDSVLLPLPLYAFHNDTCMAHKIWTWLSQLQLSLVVAKLSLKFSAIFFFSVLIGAVSTVLFFNSPTLNLFTMCCGWNMVCPHQNFCWC